MRENFWGADRHIISERNRRPCRQVHERCVANTRNAGDELR